MADSYRRNGGYRDRDREISDRGNRWSDDIYDDKHDNKYSSRTYEGQKHPYEWYRSRSQSPRRRASSPQRNGDMYHFGGDPRSNGTSRMNGHGQFTFRSGEKRNFQNGRPPPRELLRGSRRGRGHDRRFQGKGDFHPRRFGPKPAHQRKILHADNDREGTPEKLMGMAEGVSCFKAVGDIFASDSEGEAAMDLDSVASDDEPSIKRAKANVDDA
jgi:hypothetical protein